MAVLKRLLLGNRSWRQTVLKNSFWQIVAELAVRGLKVGQVFLMVRLLGPASYGSFALAMAFVSLFGILFDSGLVLTVTREFARDRVNEQLLGDVVLLKIALGVLGVSVIWIGSFYFTREASVRPMIMVLGASVFCNEWVNLSFGVLRARQRMEFECLIRVAQALGMFGAVVFVLWQSPSAFNLCLAYLAAGLITLVLLFVPFQRFKGRLHLAFRWEVWKRLMAIALPLALAGGVGSFYMNIDTVMLGWWSNMQAVGWYDAADRLSSYATIPMSLVSLVLLPAFASSSLNVDRVFRHRWDRWTASMVASGMFSVCALIAGGDWLVRLGFGAKFAPAVPTLKIMSLAIFLLYVYSPCSQALILFDRQAWLFLVLALAAIVNVALNLALIPAYGMYGAAWVAVATHAVILGGLYFCTVRFTPIRPLNRALAGALIGCSLAAGLAFPVMRMGEISSFWLTMALGTVVYALCLLALLRLDMTTGWFSIGSDLSQRAA